MLIVKLYHTATGENIGYYYGDHYVQPSDEEIMTQTAGWIFEVDTV